MAATAGPGWTKERVAVLRKLWIEGVSAAQIAKQLGGVTRNAVIGKVHRLGLEGRAAASLPGALRARPTVAARKVRAEMPKGMGFVLPPLRGAGSSPIVNPAPEVVVPFPKRAKDEPGTATLLTLGAHMCRWPIGDPQDPTFTFCGRSSEGEGSYCHHHVAVAYQPKPTKKAHTASELARSLRRYI